LRNVLSFNVQDFLSIIGFKAVDWTTYSEGVRLVI